MAIHYALDFGTTNSVLTSDRDGAVIALELSRVSADRIRTPVIPSAVCFVEGGVPLIGQSAISQNIFGRLPAFAHGFKRRLGRGSRAEVARMNGQSVSAMHAAEAFFDGVRAAARQDFRPRRVGLWGIWDDFKERRDPLLADVTLTVPVDADELYRREITSLGRRLGAKTLRLLDEPVAAAIGYGVNVERELVILVVDWGGGTLDVSIVRTGPDTLAKGQAVVLAKSAAPVGGEDVDEWIVEKFLIPLSKFVDEFEVDARQAAALAKEAASIEGEGFFRFRTMPARPFSRDDLRNVLTEHGVYAVLESALSEVIGQLERCHGLGVESIDEALLVGGSSLLPGVDQMVRTKLPSTRVNEWNAFAAVAEGACTYARGGQIHDHIYHDYALRMADDKANSVYYELIFPAGTQYPAAGFAGHRVYRPDPGSPQEMLFEIGEISRLGRLPVAWREESNGRHTWRPTEARDHDRFLTINDGKSGLRLPRSRSSDRRIKVNYGLDGDRFLRWTVLDGTNVLKENEVLGRLR